MRPPGLPGILRPAARALPDRRPRRATSGAVAPQRGGRGEPLLEIRNRRPRRFRSPVFASDWPRYGGSDHPDIDYTIDYYVEVPSQILDALELPRVALAGRSMGGAAALGLALRHPHRLRGLVLVNAEGLAADVPGGHPGLFAVHIPGANAARTRGARAGHRRAVQPGRHQTRCRSPCQADLPKARPHRRPRLLPPRPRRPHLPAPTGVEPLPHRQASAAKPRQPPPRPSSQQRAHGPGHPRGTQVEAPAAASTSRPIAPAGTSDPPHPVSAQSRHCGLPPAFHTALAPRRRDAVQNNLRAACFAFGTVAIRAESAFGSGLPVHRPANPTLSVVARMPWPLLLAPPFLEEPARNAEAEKYATIRFPSGLMDSC
jgi:pimeloyl-ACP methyl ester carboxylesterase